MYRKPVFITKKPKLHELGCLSWWCQISIKVERHGDKKAWGKDIPKDLNIT